MVVPMAEATTVLRWWKCPLNRLGRTCLEDGLRWGTSASCIPSPTIALISANSAGVGSAIVSSSIAPVSSVSRA
jgi:hypothetical protein